MIEARYGLRHYGNKSEIDCYRYMGIRLESEVTVKSLGAERGMREEKYRERQ